MLLNRLATFFLLLSTDLAIADFSTPISWHNLALFLSMLVLTGLSAFVAKTISSVRKVLSLAFLFGIVSLESASKMSPGENWRFGFLVAALALSSIVTLVSIYRSKPLVVKGDN